jgi:signal transduction histidine kinase
MISSLRFRLWLTYALVVGVVISIAGATVFFYLVRTPLDDRRELQRLKLVSNLIAQRGHGWSLLPSGLPRERIQEAVERIDHATGLRVVIMDEGGQVLSDSREAGVYSLPELSRLLQGQSRALPVYRDEQNRQWLYTLTPVQDGYYLLVAAPRPRLPALGIFRDEFLQPYLRGVLIALVLSLLFSIWIARWVAAPLRRIASAAQDVARGEYRQIPVEGPNEVRSLASSFNDMVERVQASQRSQRDFVANVSHDLKTPLTSIQGFSQAILDGTVDDPQAVQQAARVIYDEAGRMNRMVLDLLDLARLDAGTMRIERAPLDMGDLLESIVQKFAPQAQRQQIDLRCSCGKVLPTVVGDADRLAQVFTNLVDNALKHTPAGGNVALTAHQLNDWVEVQVADSGAGIPPEEMDRIFERFYQTDKSRSGGSGRGVGLGLAIAHELVLAHGGTISVYSRRNYPSSDINAATEDTPLNGSVFVVRLPIVSPDDDTVARRK